MTAFARLASSRSTATDTRSACTGAARSTTAIDGRRATRFDRIRHGPFSNGTARLTMALRAARRGLEVTEKDWLVDETQPLSKDEAREVARGEFGFETRGAEVPIAVSLHDVTIHNTRVWFNRPAEVRIDALIVSPRTEESIYHPGTYEFSGVQDG